MQNARTTEEKKRAPEIEKERRKRKRKDIGKDKRK
jgi:hypothetical protein